MGDTNSEFFAEQWFPWLDAMLCGFYLLDQASCKPLDSDSAQGFMEMKGKLISTMSIYSCESEYFKVKRIQCSSLATKKIVNLLKE